VNDRFPYASLADRPILKWPDGKRLAVWVVPNVEHYEFKPSCRSVRQPWPRAAHPDTLHYPLKEYGNRVGIDRILDVMDRIGIRCTVSLSLAVPVMFPDIFSEMRARQWEFMCHGLYNTHYLWNYEQTRERDFIRDCKVRMDALAGPVPHGWFSPACSHTVNTEDIVAECGFGYTCDLYHDDQPFPVRTSSGSLISIPYSMDVNDAMVHINGGEGEDFARIILDQFRVLYQDSTKTGLVMCIACHPYLTGQPHRIVAFERALRHIAMHDDVWFATGMEIADWYRTRHLQEVEHWLQP